MEFLPLYLAVGVVAGLLAGLFGVGGGLVIVPALVFSLTAQGVSPDRVMHIALASSLATIIFTSISSVRSHHKRGAVDWVLVMRLAPGILLGALAGGQVANWLPRAPLQWIFVVGAIAVAIHMFRSATVPARHDLPASLGLGAVGAGIGLLSALCGIGGGSLTVPFLSFCRVPIARAVATAAACGMPIAIAGTLGFVYAGWGQGGLPEAAFGYVYLPAVVGVVAASVVCAPLGAKWAHRFPAALMKRLFACLLAVLALSMLYDVIR